MTTAARHQKPSRSRGFTRLLRRYRQAVKSLEKLKAREFYDGTPVIVNYYHYEVPGVAVTDNGCSPDHVAVSLSNGNTWRYPIEAVKPASKA